MSRVLDDSDEFYAVKKKKTLNTVSTSLLVLVGVAGDFWNGLVLLGFTPLLGHTPTRDSSGVRAMRASSLLLQV